MPEYASSSASRVLPAYMRRRQNRGGPSIGEIRCTSWGPVTPTNAGLGGLILTRNGKSAANISPDTDVANIRPLALVWSCSNTPTGSTLQMLASVSISSGSTGGMIVAANTVTVTAIDLATYPTGILYVGDPANSSPANIYEIINNNVDYASAVARTWPDTGAVGGASSTNFIKFSCTIGGVAPANLCYHLFYYFTKQINIGGDSDTVPGGLMND